MGKVVGRILGPKGELLVTLEKRRAPAPDDPKHPMGFQPPSAREKKRVPEPIPETPVLPDGPVGAGEPVEEEGQERPAEGAAPGAQGV